MAISAEIRKNIWSLLPAQGLFSNNFPQSDLPHNYPKSCHDCSHGALTEFGFPWRCIFPSPGDCLYYWFLANAHSCSRKVLAGFPGGCRPHYLISRASFLPWAQPGPCLLSSVQGPAGRTLNILCLTNKKSHSCSPSKAGLERGLAGHREWRNLLFHSKMCWQKSGPFHPLLIGDQTYLKDPLKQCRTIIRKVLPLTPLTQEVVVSSFVKEITDWIFY